MRLYKGQDGGGELKERQRKRQIIGYAQLYFRIAGERETYYACFDGEFRKTFTWLRLWSIKKAMKRAYERYDTIYSVDFCTKEEWEEKRYGDEITVSWGEDEKKG